MRINTSILLIMLVGLANALSCSKDQSTDCIKKAGKTVQKTVQLADFNTLYIGDQTEVELIYNPGQKPFAEITYNEHLLSNYKFIEKENTLRIEDQNTCNFVRSFNNIPKVKLYVNELLWQINMDGASSIFNKDSLKMMNLVINNNSVGDVNLTVWEVYGMECNGFNSGRFFIKGFAGYIASTIDDVSVLDTRGLILHDLYLFHYSLLPSHVGSQDLLHIKLYGKGDVFVHETPSDSTRQRCCDIKLETIGKGKIVQ